MQLGTINCSAVLYLIFYEECSWKKLKCKWQTLSRRIPWTTKSGIFIVLIYLVNYFELLKTITVRLGDPRNFSTETLLPIQENLLTCCYEKNAEFVDWKKKSLQIDLLLNKPVLKAILHCLWRTANRIKIIAVIFQISNDWLHYSRTAWWKKFIDDRVHINFICRLTSFNLS